MRVYLDDERPTPDGWVRCYWPDEVISLLEAGGVDELSLDHDLGNDARGTGYDVLVWMERAVAERGFDPPRVHLHTQNVAGRQRMKLALQSIHRLLTARDQE